MYMGACCKFFDLLHNLNSFSLKIFYNVQVCFVQLLQYFNARN